MNKQTIKNKYPCDNKSNKYYYRNRNIINCLRAIEYYKERVAFYEKKLRSLMIRGGRC